MGHCAQDQSRLSWNLHRHGVQRDFGRFTPGRTVLWYPYKSTVGHSYRLPEE